MSREAWPCARRKLFHSLKGVCDEIGRDLENLIPKVGQTVMDNEVICGLQERAALVDGLVEQNGLLAKELQSLRQEAKGTEEQKAPYSTPAQIQRAVQAGDAEHSPPKRSSSSKDFRTPGLQVLAPPPPATDLQESDDVRYKALTDKYNELAQNFKELKTARNIVADALAQSKAKSREWNRYADGRDQLIVKKDNKIAGLVGEIQTLKLRVDELEASFESNHSGVTTPTGHNNSPTSQLRPFQELLNFINIGLFQDGGKVIHPHALPTYLHGFSIEDSFDRDKRDAEVRVFADEEATPSSETLVKSQPLSQLQFGGVQEPQLPCLVDDAGPYSGISEGRLEVVHGHHSSSTQDTSSPNRRTEESLDAAVAEAHFEESLSSPDVPVVIFSRSVRKRKRGNDLVEAASVSKVKVEQAPSSPMGLAALRYEESVDLDEIGNKIDTPRKRRQMLLARSGQPAKSRTALESVSHTAVRSAFMHNTEEESYTPTARRVAPVLAPLSANKQVRSRTSLVQVVKPKRLISNKAIADVSEDGENTPPLKFPRKSHSSTPDIMQRLGSLLGQPSPPKQILKSARLGVSKTLQGPAATISPRSGLLNQLTQTKHAYGQETVSKGGTEAEIANDRRELFIDYNNHSASKVLSKPSLLTSKSAATSGHASTRSATTLAQSPALSQQTRPSLSRGSCDGFVDTARPGAGHGTVKVSIFTPNQPRGEPVINVSFSRLAAGGGTPSVRKRLQLESEERTFIAVVAPEHEPLRCRPLETLSIEDFKINPGSNQGYKYAFSDVVRAKASRECLPGCTKPECCGNTFRALAEVQRNPDDPLTPSQEEADARLLADFMGDNIHKLRNMSKDEKNEILLQARTRELAKKHGKHRHAFERRKSPPGFWRTDFPTTQEETTDRQEAREFERQLIAQRYEEAMRPGGAYLFRDE